MGILLDQWGEHPDFRGDGGVDLLVEDATQVAAGQLFQRAAERLGGWRVEDDTDPERPVSHLVRSRTRLEFIRPMQYQQASLDSPARVKLFREGRRAGKTRKAWRAAFAGHGPVGDWFQGQGFFREEWHGPLHRGILSGRDVVWIARDQVQARVVWLEEVVPKFRGRPGVYVNSQERYLQLEGHGSLYVRSNENIDSVRGIGANLIGAIVDEAAHFDLEYALREVLQPALLDNEGWLILMSTTNAGRDGNQQRPAGPSYFNLCCEQVQKGEREGWEEFHSTARDNPRITPAAFQALYDDYPEGSHAAAQEIDAKLLKGLHGVMFSRWRDEVHICDFHLAELQEWHWEAGLDWGTGSAGWFGLGAFGPNRQEHLHVEYSFNGKADPAENETAYEVGKRVGRLLQSYPLPRRIVADDSMWGEGEQQWKRGKTDQMEFERGLREILGQDHPRLVRAVKGKGSRVQRVRLFQQSIRYVEVEVVQPDGSTRREMPPWGRPRFTSHSRCEVFNRTTPALPVDPGNADDVDTNAYDHPFDGWTYLTNGRPKHGVQEEKTKSPHKSEGIGKYLPKPAPVGAPRWERNQ